MIPAIIIAGYNRIECIKRIMTSVEAAYYPVDNVPLVISIDNSGIENEIIDAIKKIGWSHGTITFRTFDERLGLKKHILSCGDLSEKYDAVIVLEDDLYVSPNYYSYVMQMLDFYENEDRVCGVSLYCHSWNGYGNYQFLPQKNEYDVFLGQIGVSWGQCWTKGQWKQFKKWYENNKEIEKFDNDIPWTINEWGSQSWAKYFYNYMVEENKFYVLPYTSLSTNFSDVGEHNMNTSNAYQVMLLDAKEMNYRVPIFDEAIKYDMFFERVLDDNFKIGGVSGENICINLNGYRQYIKNKKYLLTCKKYDDLIPIKSYGLKLRPIEQNVLKDIPGDDIFLYDASLIKEKNILNYRKTSYQRIEYELYGNPQKRLDDYCSYIKRGGVYYDIIQINENAWKMEGDYSKIQIALQEKMKEKKNLGSTWMFHEVTNDKTEWKDPLYAINAESFELLIKKSINSGKQFNNVYDICGKLNEKSIVLTFDDGFSGVYEFVYPICKKYRIPFCIFITVNYLDTQGYLNRKQLKELAECELCTIGGHTLNHPKLRLLSDKEIEKEIIQGKKQLEKIINKKVDIFAYPYGSVQAVDYRSIDVVRKANFKMAFSTLASHNVDMNEVKFFLPRININEAIVNKILMS